MLVDSLRCEVLNASYDPLSIVTVRRALNLCIKGKATVLQEHPDHMVYTANEIFPAPTQILLKEMVRSHRMTRAPAELTQRNMFVRDKYICQYCERHKTDLAHNEFLTRDHVIPRSKGGKDAWNNVTTACNSCNNRKADYMVDDPIIDMKLLKQPYSPTVFEIWSKSKFKVKKPKD